MIQTDSISRTMCAPSHLHRECPNSFRIASHSPAPGCRPSGTSGNSSSTRGCPTSPCNHLRSFLCPKEDLVSSAVPSNWERLAFISSPIRVIRFSSAPFYNSYILYFLTKFPHTWTLTCLLKSLAIFLSILKNSANAFLKLLVILLFQNL